MIKKFILESRKKGYNDDEIKKSLLSAGFNSELIEDELNKKSYWWLVLIVLIIVFGIVAIIYLDNSCNIDSDCGSGVCVSGKCAVNVGMVNCQQEVNCEEGFDCFKCLSASAGI
ncbi:hypothetical protein J4467_00085 [Candidatus Woesearchaeota archaeon]|nr:hypothetical protein [Candidatus Woesearchaeota archaeon]